MIYVVSRPQFEGWKHPLVQRVVNAAMLGTSQELSDELETVVLESQLMQPFLPLPFTADSTLGQRVAAALAKLKKKFSMRAMASEFRWKFWRPREDMVDALCVADFLAAHSDRQQDLVEVY
jgi:hypothetical protein